MDSSLRLRLSVMMFLQYFIWGAWGVVIFTYIGASPADGGLNFPGTLQAWIGATMPIGAMISPIFIGLFADRLFDTEKVLACLHLVGAALLAFAAYSTHTSQELIEETYAAVAKEQELEDGGTLADALVKEQELKREVAARTEPFFTTWYIKLTEQLNDDKQKQFSEKQKQSNENALERRKKEYDDFSKKIKADVEKLNQQPEVKAASVSAFYWLFGILIAYALCFMPTLTLTNSLSFRNLSDPDKYFGGIRVWGTIGWIVAGFVVGFYLNSVSPKPLYLAAGVSAGLGLFCFLLPHTPPAGRATTLGETLGLPALAMLKSFSFLIFFICSFLIMIVLAFYYQQANPFLEYLRVENSAAVQTLGQVSEIFFMLLIPVGLRFLGTKGMLTLGLFAWCVRYAIFASLSKTWVVALGLPLHGICYDFFFVVSYLYVDRKAPPNLRASAQGMITFVTLGIGWFFGNLLTGWVTEVCTDGKAAAWLAQQPEGVKRIAVEARNVLGWNLDAPWTEIWIVPLAGSVLATLLFVLLFHERKTKPATPVAG